jgi:hypothetical protein
MQEAFSKEEWRERRRGNNKALSDQIAISSLYRNIKQYFGPERGLAIIRWLQVGQGEKPTFDEKCKVWLLSEELVGEVREVASKTDFSAFSTGHDKWVQATQDLYKEIIQRL